MQPRQYSIDVDGLMHKDVSKIELKREISECYSINAFYHEHITNDMERPGLCCEDISS